jgi:hypothetical protein
MIKIDWSVLVRLSIFFVALSLSSCSNQDDMSSVKEILKIPRGYVPVITIYHDDQRYFFGPFIGYYFRPANPDDLDRLRFVCFNERGFYTDSLPQNTLIYEGEAIFQELAGSKMDIPKQGGRIRPVFFDEASEVWLTNRPKPQAEYLHFHSCYNKQGAALLGYWLCHRALQNFTYNMGGRLPAESVLYHQVAKGVDHDFAKIIEFDMGPDDLGR